MQALAWEGQRFQSQYQSLVHRSSRFVCLFLVALCKALYHRLYILVKVVIKKTLHPALPLILYLWQKSDILRGVVKAFLIKPMATILVVLYLWLRELQAMRHQKGDQYQPAQVAIDMAKDQQ